MKTKILIFIVFFLGIAALAYPTLSDVLNKNSQAKVIETYSDAVSKMEEAELKKEMEKAHAYNDNLGATILIDPFTQEMAEELKADYLDILNVDNTMARIVIPKISVDLPIYHGTGAEALQKGVGHLQNTSVPVGGEGTHSVLSGHRGLPSAKLFTDLDELEEGDTFYIYVLNEVLLYTVDQIKVVEPAQTDDLLMEEGKDYITLVTCTPYGVNSHRLLVRGVRTPLPESEEEWKEIQEIAEETHSAEWMEILYLVSILLFAVIFTLILFLAAGNRRRRKRKRRKKRRTNRGRKRKHKRKKSVKKEDLGLERG